MDKIQNNNDTKKITKILSKITNKILETLDSMNYKD